MPQTHVCVSHLNLGSQLYYINICCPLLVLLLYLLILLINITPKKKLINIYNNRLIVFILLLPVLHFYYYYYHHFFLFLGMTERHDQMVTKMINQHELGPASGREGEKLQRIEPHISIETIMFAAKLQAIAIVATVALTMTSAAQTATLRLSKHVVDSPPRSRVHALLTNGSSIPAGGSVWPTAIYWTTVQVGTPPKDFPVAIDSGSGDLDISGKGCSGCPTASPNNQYDSSESSTASAAFPYVFSNSYQTCDLKQPTAVCTISENFSKTK